MAYREILNLETLENNITIVTVCDNHYAVMLAALLKSIELNYKSKKPIDLYIVEDGLKARNKKRIIESIDPDLFSINWIDIDEIMVDKSNLPSDNSSFPLNVYARLFIPHFIPQHLNKVIYLDVDMILEKDITDLWNIDMKDSTIAGVVDRSEVVSSPWGGISNYKELGIDANTKYFNSGLLLIDPIMWRKRNMTYKVIKCVNENKKFTSFPDQYGLNVVFAGEWLVLDKKWNCYAMSKETKPFLIHFIGIKPIYASYQFNQAYKDRFFYYLNLTKWQGYRPLGNYYRLLNKMYNKILKKIL